MSRHSNRQGESGGIFRFWREYHADLYKQPDDRAEDSGYGSRGYSRRRDSMGRYSRDGYSMAQRLREMSHDAPDETTRREMDRLASRMESM